MAVIGYHAVPVDPPPAGAAALSDNPLAPPAAGPPPLRPPNLSGARSDPALIRSWLALKPSPHTQRAYARAVQDFLAWSGPTSLAAVTVTLLQAWRAHLETRLAPASVNARLAALKSLLAPSAPATCPSTWGPRNRALLLFLYYAGPASPKPWACNGGT